MEPNPSVRRDEDFPKTTTVPEQWVTDALMDAYNPPSPDAPEQEAQRRADRAEARACEDVRQAFVTTSKPLPLEDESPFARRLDPFPARADQNGAWL